MSTLLKLPSATHYAWLAKRLADKKFADARFIDIENGDHRREFVAHKLVLASVSDVFEAMFYGNFPEEDPVKIEDTTIAAFEALLEFIYTGTVTVDPDNAFPLLDLAKKYLVGSLPSLILEHLRSSVNESNVAQLVLHGQNYFDDAPETFWSSIEENARPLVESKEFLLLKKPTVVDLLRRSLAVEETAIFERVVAWGEAECERKDLPLTPTNVRSALDGVLRLVRFPLMGSKKFTLGPAKSELLTQEELVDIYPWFTAKVTPTLFSTAQRDRAYVCDKLTSTTGSWNCAGLTDAIQFKVDRSVTITGVGVWGSAGDGPAGYTISVELHASGKVQTKQVATVTSKPSEPIMLVNFSKPVRVMADGMYTLVAKVTGAPTRRGSGGVARRVVQTSKGALTFSFSESSLSNIHNNIEYGLLPQIMFRV